MDQKGPSQSHFHGFAWGIAGKSLEQTVLGWDQAATRDEEVLPLLQRMGYFTTMFDAHLYGNWMHSHAHAWLHM